MNNKNYSGNYCSVNEFVYKNKLKTKAKKVFGKNWEAENDIEQIQELIGDSYVVKAIEPTTKREERMDDYIEVIKKTQCEICSKHPATRRDYRFIDSCGLQGKCFVCEFCVSLNDVAISEIVRDSLDPKDFYEFEGEDE